MSLHLNHDNLEPSLQKRMTRSSSIVQDDSIISDHNEMNKKHRHRRLQLSQSYKSHSCSRLDSTFCKSSTLSLLQDYEIDQSEIRKVLVRSLPPLASNHFMEHSFHSNPSKNGRILIPLIYSVLQKQGITTIEEFGQRKEYYHAGQEIPQVLIEFIHGLKWQGCHLRNTVRNVEAGPFQFEKLSILDDISEYLETLQCIDMKRHIFISVTGRDIIGVDPDLIHSSNESNFKVFVFRKKSLQPEPMLLSELIEHCSILQPKQ